MNGNEEVHGSAVVAGTTVTFGQEDPVAADPVPVTPVRTTSRDGGLAGVTINVGGHTVSGMNGDEDLGQNARVTGTPVSYSDKQ